MSEITSPKQFFGFQLGSDRKMARWDQILDYFYTLEEESNKIKVRNMGPTTKENPFLLVFISAPENLNRLDHYKSINARLSDPRRISQKEVETLIEKGKAIICQSMSLHATEIGGTQMAPELAFDLLSREDEEAQRILENVIFLMIPCFNPDGEIMVTDWYREWKGTEYEGVHLPKLYHKYVGHDNNRDAYMTNMVESQYAAEIMFREWHPQAYQDHHHMWGHMARFYIAPYCEPIHPYADPLIWREHDWYGSHMAYKLEEKEKAGVLNDAQFAGWGHLGFHWIGNYHNIASMLTESAAAKLATPVYYHKEQLEAGSTPIRGFPKYDPQTNFPHPWEGGWWHLRDIVEQQKIASWALLDIAARNKKTVLRNAYKKAKRQIKKGKRGDLKAYVIPHDQHDPLTAQKMIKKLLTQGIEIKKAKKDFSVEHTIYNKGSHVIFLDQPKRGLIKTLLGKTFYPDDPWTRKEDGSPASPYDTATDTIAEFMGVRVDPIDTKPKIDFQTLKFSDYEKPKGRIIGESNREYLFDGRLNDSFKAVNLLLNKGIQVERIDEHITTNYGTYPPGSFLVAPGKKDTLQKIAEKTGVNFYSLEQELSINKHQVDRERIGMYRRYWGGNIDEGWTRWLLEQFGFPYSSLRDEDIRGKLENKKEETEEETQKNNHEKAEIDLNEKYDVIIFPNDDPTFITGDGAEEKWEEGWPSQPNFPPEYRSGLEEEGVEAIKNFVEEGGTLITFGQACTFAIEELDIHVENIIKNIDPKDFFCPGSTLHVDVDTSHPLCYGMPKESLILLWNDGDHHKCPVFRIKRSSENENYEAPVKFPERNLLQSGWLIGEDKIAEYDPLVSLKYGEGKIILIGFRTQFRSQTHGTFKLFFNALLS